MPLVGDPVLPQGQLLIADIARGSVRPVQAPPIAVLETADIGELTRRGWSAPLHVVVKARDGVTDLHGWL